MARRGLYVGFCGLDGVGKSTQARHLHRSFKELRRDVIIHDNTRHFVSEISTNIAMRHGVDWGFEYVGIDPYTIAMSFEVLREEVLGVHPYVLAGMSIISSRTAFDHLARRKARGCSERIYELAEEIVLSQGQPDITIWLQAPPEVAFERIVSRGYDYSDLRYLENFNAAFLELSLRFNWLTIDAREDSDVIHASVLNEVLCKM